MREMMNNMKFKTISLRLADLYYQLKGEISLLEIKALPFIDEKEARMIVQFLSSKYGITVR